MDLAALFLACPSLPWQYGHVQYPHPLRCSLLTITKAEQLLAPIASYIPLHALFLVFFEI